MAGASGTATTPVDALQIPHSNTQAQHTAHDKHGKNGHPGAIGSVSAVSGTTITITGKNGLIYTIDAAKAKVMKAGATISVSDIKVGDMLYVRGTAAGTTITATAIMDGPAPSSVGRGGKRNANAVFGTITAVNGTSFTVQSEDIAGAAASWTVNTAASTVFRKDGDMRGQSALPSDAVVGESVVVIGVKDAASHTLTATNVRIMSHALGTGITPDHGKPKKVLKFHNHKNK